MKTRELFQKDPLSWRLLNEGVSSNNSTDADTLRYELQTFVCEGEYHAGLFKILQGYLGNLDKEQKAAWVSGFYGSGKSHLVKVLRYLWTDYRFEDGSTARSVATLPQDTSELLKELSTRGKQRAGLHSAGGTLKAGAGSARFRLLSIILQSAGLPEKLAVARLVMDLRDDGKQEAVEKAITKAGKRPSEEFERIYTSKVLQEAYLGAYPHHGSIKAVSEALRSQYPAKVDDISIDEMIKVIRRAIARNGALPLTVVVLDEIQQFINNSADVALEVQEVVEACCKQLDGRVLFVGTGQSALSDTPALQRLMGRFTIKTHLRDNDVEKVVRTVVLQKKPARKSDIEELVDKHAGEVSRQLKGTKIATRSDDTKAYVPDYPLLPVRRRFWEHVLHSTDPTGTTAQMRTQLRVTHEACKAVADRELGAVIPADFLYDQLANELVISGEMQKRFQEIIEEQKTKTDGGLRSRICALVFLINKLPREGADIGVRATPEHLSDLLTDDLRGSATKLREQVPPLVEKLAAEGVLMDIEGEYCLQTTEGAAWETEFRRRRSSFLNNEPQLASTRGQLLSRALQDELSGVSVLHGAAKEKRKAAIHYGAERPAVTEGVCVWVRDGFQESENAILQEIQKRPVDDATIHVLIKRTKADELKSAIASALAAEETLNFQGSPSSNEGKAARAAMQTRLATEQAKTDDHIKEVLSKARVFLSGGEERPVISLREAVEDAAQDVLGRLYPKFNMADSANWPTVWQRAKEGNAAAFSAVGHSGDPDKHAVAAELLRFVGAGKKGSEVAAVYREPPYGWPKDAIDATLAVLMVSGHLSARLQGRAVKISELDQRKISQADFRVEHPVLTAPQKLRIRQLYKDVGLRYQPGDEAVAAPDFVAAVKTLAGRAGGDPPAPEPPRAPQIYELEGQAGNDLLFMLFDKADDLTTRIKEWMDVGAKLEARRPGYALAVDLLRFAGGLEGTAALEATLEDISVHRSLLDDPDPVSPILRAVGVALRAALQRSHAHYEATFEGEGAQLEGHSTWTALPAEKRQALLRAAGAEHRTLPTMGTDAELLAALRNCDLASWRTHADALPTRFSQALASVVKEAEPKAQRIQLPSATIRGADDLEAWLCQARTRINDALKDGPVIL